MGPVLNGLLKLQSVENRLRAEKAKLTRCRRNVVIQENLIRSLQNALEAKKEEVQLTKVQFDRLELELKTKDDIIARLRASLNSAKTNKEYAAVLTQLNTTKADNSKIETQSLELLKDIEADESEVKDIQKQIDEQKETLEQTRKESEILASKYQAEIDNIQIEWDQAAQTIPNDTLDQFKRVAETYDGHAVALIEQQGNKKGAYSCGGCFMGITAESVNLLMTKDDIIRCPNCTRILVLGNLHEP
jgi:predicted  nucleic acid-binding Zn-ribbon protein